MFTARCLFCLACKLPSVDLIVGTIWLGSWDAFIHSGQMNDGISSDFILILSVSTPDFVHQCVEMNISPIETGVAYAEDSLIPSCSPNFAQAVKSHAKYRILINCE